MATDGDANGSDAGRKRKAEDSFKGERSICPYLDTIQRSLLDFDFEPACSVTLETGPHIYACLVCSKYFRGRGPLTPAHTHAVEESHYVFVHLSQGSFHCLPDDYEIHDPSLCDIRAALHPTFTEKDIASIDFNSELSRDLFGRRYLPGFVGLNNLQKTDGINAVVQALAHVPPLRDYFLRQRNHDGVDKNSGVKFLMSKNRSAVQVADHFGELVRKIWSDKRFKSHVDPHMLVQAITAASKKKYQIGVQVEVGEFMAWFLHQLHVGTGGTKKAGSSIIQKVFQGKVRVTSRQPKQIDQEENKGTQDDRAGSDDEEGIADVEMGANDNNNGDDHIEETVADVPFLQLTLEIPEKPLFRDEDGGLVIPQEPLVNVLRKFDGITFSEAMDRSGIVQRRRYQILKLPTYLILHLARFKTNRYIKEKNPTIVVFPVKNLNLSDYVSPEGGKVKPPTEEQVRAMSVGELKKFLQKYGKGPIAQAAIEKDELVEAAVNFALKSLPDLLLDKYDLVANITHESPAEVGKEGKSDPLQEGSYKCHVQHRGTQQWYEMQDLHVNEIMPQQIGLSESYLLVFERKSAKVSSLGST